VNKRIMYYEVNMQKRITLNGGESQGTVTGLERCEQSARRPSANPAAVYCGHSRPCPDHGEALESQLNGQWYRFDNRGSK
jgi:hypothetical protein